MVLLLLFAFFLAWENSRRHRWFPREMTSEKSILMTTRHYPDLGKASDWLKQIFNQSEALSHKSSVWNFCARFSDVISRGNQWWRSEMSAVFSGYFFPCISLLFFQSCIVSFFKFELSSCGLELTERLPFFRHQKMGFVGYHVRTLHLKRNHNKFNLWCIQVHVQDI